MAIHLITGVPGAGKTLYTLCVVKARSDKENRPVFYFGINDLTLPWHKLDKGEDWHTCPPNSIIVIDECQKVFRPRGNGAPVPEHVSKLETHRHQGLDLYVITQHPMLTDTNLRRLIEIHFHVRRAFGMHKATIHEFKELRPNPDQTREGSIRHDFVYPKSAFAYYKSAEVHTHKRHIPMKVWFLFAVPLIIGTLGWFAYKRLMSIAEPKKPSVEATASEAKPKGAQSNALSFSKRKDDYEWLAEQKPRIVGLPHTAPMYDPLAKVSAMPLPAACIQMNDDCRCYTQQGTRIADVQPVICKQIVNEGWFNPFLVEDKHEELHKVRYSNEERGQTNIPLDVNSNNIVMLGNENTGTKKR